MTISFVGFGASDATPSPPGTQIAPLPTGIASGDYLILVARALTAAGDSATYSTPTAVGGVPWTFGGDSSAGLGGGIDAHFSWWYLFTTSAATGDVSTTVGGGAFFNIVQIAALRDVDSAETLANFDVDLSAVDVADGDPLQPLGTQTTDDGVFVGWYLAEGVPSTIDSDPTGWPCGTGINVTAQPYGSWCSGRLTDGPLATGNAPILLRSNEAQTGFQWVTFWVSAATAVPPTADCAVLHAGDAESNGTVATTRDGFCDPDGYVVLDADGEYVEWSFTLDAGQAAAINADALLWLRAMTLVGATFDLATALATPQVTVEVNGGGAIPYVPVQFADSDPSTLAQWGASNYNAVWGVIDGVNTIRLTLVQKVVSGGSPSVTFTEDFTGSDGDPWSGAWTALSGHTGGTIQSNAGNTAAGEGSWADTAATGDRDIEFDLPYAFPGVKVSLLADLTTNTFDDLDDSGLAINTTPGGELAVSPLGTTSGLALTGGDVIHVLIELRGANVDAYIWKNADPQPGSPSLSGAVAHDGPYIASAGIAGGSIDSIVVTEVPPDVSQIVSVVVDLIALGPVTFIGDEACPVCGSSSCATEVTPIRDFPTSATGTISGRPPLLCAEYTVWIADRVTGATVVRLPSTGWTLKFNRRVDRTSNATLIVDYTAEGQAMADCCSRLGRVGEWMHELVVQREGNPQEQWGGPIMGLEDDPKNGTLTISADDRSAWWDERALPYDLNYVGADLHGNSRARDAARVFVELLRAAEQPTSYLGVPNSGGQLLPYDPVGLEAHAYPTGVMIDKKVLLKADDVVIGEELRTLGGSVLDWTVIGRRVYIGALVINLEPLPLLRQEHWVEHDPVISRQGRGVATKVVVRGSGDVRGEYPPGQVTDPRWPQYGSHFKRIRDSAITDPQVATERARGYWERWQQPNFQVLSSRGTLGPLAPVTTDDLIPGRAVLIAITEGCMPTSLKLAETRSNGRLQYYAYDSGTPQPLVVAQRILEVNVTVKDSMEDEVRIDTHALGTERRTRGQTNWTGSPGPA